MKVIKYQKLILFIQLLIIPTSISYAQRLNEPTPLSRILFVFDASQSMNATWESDKKVNIARKFLIHIIDSLEKVTNFQMALRVYGHQSPVPPQDCKDTRLEVPFENGNASRIRQRLRYLLPKGTTPIAYALSQTINDFPKQDNTRNIIILITDGVEACEGDPCEVSKELQKQGLLLKPFVIGIGLDPGFQRTFECVGRFFNATNEEKYKEILDVVINEALNETTAQVNLLDAYGMPTETNVNMTFYDHTSGKVKYNYIHTINHRGNPDTLALDPLMTYDLVVHTIPPISKNDIKLTPGIHNIIALDASQGFLHVKTSSRVIGSEVPVIVRDAKTKEIIYIQQLNEKQKYRTGTYNLDILTLPRVQVKNIEIKQSHTTTVEIPKPGIVTFLMSSPGYGSIFKEDDDYSLTLIYNLNPNLKRESVELQPGRYVIVYRPKGVKNTLYTISKKFEISSGGSFPLNLSY